MPSTRVQPSPAKSEHHTKPEIPKTPRQPRTLRITTAVRPLYPPDALRAGVCTKRCPKTTGDGASGQLFWRFGTIRPTNEHGIASTRPRIWLVRRTDIHVFIAND